MEHLPLQNVYYYTLIIVRSPLGSQKTTNRRKSQYRALSSVEAIKREEVAKSRVYKSQCLVAPAKINHETRVHLWNIRT